MNTFNNLILFGLYLKGITFGIRTNLAKICVYLLLIMACWWLYIRFNTIPVYKNEIELYEYKSTDLNPQIWINANVNYGIYHNTSVAEANSLLYQQGAINSKVISPIFTDSLLSKAKHESQLRKCDKIGENSMNEKYLDIYNFLKESVDTFNIKKAIYIVDLKYKQTCPSFAVKWTITKNQIIDNLYKYTRLFDIGFSKDDETGQKTIEGHIIKIESDQTIQYCKQDMLWSGLSYGNAISNSFSSIYKLYDISQAYIIFNYEGNASLDHVRFNFGSAVTFTGINPDHAEIGMDYVIYNNSVFLNSSKIFNRPINDFNIRFHIAPKDTQNLQTMRLFVLTTIFSLLLTLLVRHIVIIAKTKIYRFIPKMRDNKDGNNWAVYDTWLDDFSQFSCHSTYNTRKVCLLNINKCNKEYKKHFKASVYIIIRNKNHQDYAF